MAIKNWQKGLHYNSKFKWTKQQMSEIYRIINLVQKEMKDKMLNKIKDI